MITKDKITELCNELSKRITARGHTVQSVSYKGTAVEVVITLIVDNKYDFYVVFDDWGSLEWLRILHEEGYCV